MKDLKTGSYTVTYKSGRRSDDTSDRLLVITLPGRVEVMFLGGFVGG